MNKYVNPGTDLRAGSGNGLPLNWAEARTTDVLPMSAAQLGIWFAQRLDPLSAAYNIGEYLEIDGSDRSNTIRKGIAITGLRN